ncbi:MAG: DEAD/DEAH box helicase [Lachnospiraceae bacterium]|nr:DEAD/DEAH box helicase [Lachnospiraceae bacterium]
MLRLSRTGIRNLAASDIVYSRGLQYYKGNRVVNAAFSKSSKQYRFVVKGSYNYNVVLSENEDGSFEYNCNCPGALKEKGACKHVIAALLFLLKYQEKSMMEKPQTVEEKKAFQVLDYFSNQDDTKLTGEIFHIEPTITIPSILKGEEARAYLTLHAGSNKMYKVQSVKKFLTDYRSGENIVLGKDFKFIAGESEFDKESERLINYLLEVLEIQEAIDKTFYTRLFNKSQMILTRNMLMKVMQNLHKNSFHLELYTRTYEDVKFSDSNPNIKYDLDVFEDSILLDYREREPVIPLSEGGELIYHNGFVYMPNKKFLRNYVPFYNTLGKDKKALVFRGENKQRFLEEVLPKLHDTMDIEIPESLKSRYLNLDMKASIYFDKYNDAIKAELHFKYGDYEFNCFDDPRPESYIIVRQKEAEYEVMRQLELLDFEPHSSFYLLKNDNSIFEFLTGKIDDLNAYAELFYSESFKKIGVRPTGNFKVGLRVSNDIDLLEMEIGYEDIPQDELKDLFRSFQLKKKYYRLKDGSFIDLEDENIEKVSEILDNLNVNPKTMSAEESIKLSKSSAFYLEDALRDTSFFVEKNEDFDKLIGKILTPGSVEFNVPAGIQAELRPYQVTGYRWLRTLSENSLGGILADDMGLGKTLQSIVYIASRLEEDIEVIEKIDNDDRDKKAKIMRASKITKMKRESGGNVNNLRKFLIVCPTSLVYNWQDEFENFAPYIKTSVISGNPQERQTQIENVENINVFITSYPLIRRDITHYQNIKFDTVFIDEAQFIKNAASLNAQSVKQLIAAHKFALTGTPIENSLSELWSIFDFIMPNYLMSHSKFVNRFEKLIMKDDKEALESLNRRIHPFVLRRMKKDVLTELPDKIEEKILTEMTDEQRKVYLSYMESVRNDVFSEINANGIEKSQMKILAALTRLRQICCHPSTFIDNYTGGSGKLELLMQVVGDAIANEHRILIFSQFTSMLKLIEEELKKKNVEYFYLEGSTPIEERNDYVKRFNGGEGSVFLISLKAGGTGLNLTGADTVIHYDPWWNPAVEEQATDRVYRIGQKNNVHVIKLLTKNTIEEKIFKLQKKKKQLSDAIIQSKEVFINTLTKEELEDIFR